MSIPSDETIQQALDELTARYGNEPNFVSVEFREPGELFCTFSGPPPASPAAEFRLRERDGREFSVPLHFVEGPEIGHQFGRVGIDELAVTVGNGTMGGDECRNANEMNYYGTITMYCGSIQLQTSGAHSMNCTTAPALVSNNHVIARSDAGHAGDVIWTQTLPTVAKLHCVVPLKWNTSSDIAAATLTNPASVQRWAVRGIGPLNKLRRPNIGEAIRKHGARTGLTSGKVTGKANIKVDGRMYNGVFVTSRGMGCPGDSGSAVVAANGDLLGVFSWGETIDCAKGPVGYFFTMVNPGTLTQSDRSEIVIEP